MKTDYRTIKNYPVKLQDCDPAGKIHLHRLMDYAQDADEANCRLLGVNDQVLRKKNACWIILANQFRFPGNFPLGGEDLIVETWSQGIRGIRFYRRNRYYTEVISDQILFGESISEWILCAADTHRPVRPHTVIDLEAFMEVSDNEEVDPRDWDRLQPLPDHQSSASLFSMQVGYSDLDFNVHMHNTHYARLAVDAAARTMGLDPRAEQLHIRNFKIQFNSETELDSVLTVRSSPSPEEDQIMVSGYAGETSSFVARVGYERVKGPI